MRRPSHTTLVAYLALFLALGAGGAMAAGKLAKNSVGANQLKKNSVTGAKIKANAVTGAKVKDGSLTGSDLADGTITGAKVADGSLSQSDIGGPLRASNVMGIALTKECTPAGPLPAGVSASQLATGCKLVFGSSVLECAVTATVAIVAGGIIILAERTAQTRRIPDSPNELGVFTFNAGTAARLPVDLTIVC